MPGPTTVNVSTVSLGLAQIRLGASHSNIASTNVVLTTANSMGAMANTKFTSTIDFYHLESGYPLMEDAIYPIREKASMEVAFKEVTPQNLAFARGLDASTGYSAIHSGEIALGNTVTPAFIRMEAVYTYPNGANSLNIIFPRAQILSSVELDYNSEEPLAVPVTIEAKRADSSIVSGNAAWNNRAYGRLHWT